MKAEYRSLAHIIAEITWNCYFLSELRLSFQTTLFIGCDNVSAIFIIFNSIFHACTKYIELDCYFVYEKVVDKELDF